MGNQKLNPKILLKLKKNFPDKTENGIQVRLSQLSSQHGVTLNAAAEIMARKAGFHVWGLLEEKDKECFRDKKVQIINVKNRSSKNKKIISFIKFETNNPFLKDHLDEINRCYTFHCYTATFILIRKVIENLITEIIKKKFPEKSKIDRELYLNFGTGHIRDLSELIKNLKEKSSDFAPDEKKLIQRILQLSEKFKDDANDKTHSLYHVSSKNELDDANPQRILDLVSEFFNPK